MISRRTLIAGTTAAAGLAGSGASVFGQARTVDGWPSRAVRAVVPAAAGGPSETLRFYTEHLREAFGQGFVLENMPGASGAIGSAAVARAEPDGHTLLYTASSYVVIAPLVAARKAFDRDKDFEPIALTVTYPFCLLVNAELPVKTLPELIAYVKASPGKYNFGSIGIGTGGHLVTEMLVRREGLQAVHIPFTGGAAQIQALSANTTQFTVDTVSTSRGAVDAGKVRRIAVTGARRTDAAPETPTFKELGYDDFELLLWLGLMAPKGTPKGIVDAINGEIIKINKRPEVREKLLQIAMQPELGSPADFAKMIEDDVTRWSQVVRDTGVQIPK